MSKSHTEYLARKVMELNEQDLQVFFRILRAKASSASESVENANTVTIRTGTHLTDKKYWSDADKISFAKAQSVYLAADRGFQSINRHRFTIGKQK
jgi:hypothetical protein